MKLSPTLIFLFFTFFISSCSKEETYIPVNDILPTASDDIIASSLITTVEIPILFNDTTGDSILPNSLNIVGGEDTDGNGTLDTYRVLGQGLWKIDSNGLLSFTPTSGISGNPTPIKYFGKDKENNKSNEANVVINAEAIANVNLTNVYTKLSDYKFFVGNIKDQLPSLNVLPYEPASSLFTDYAKKKRFVWMPIGTKATYNGDNESLELPVGSALIKTFYYDKVQNVLPVGSKRIIETRIMLKTANGWIFADYVWNESQTEALYDVSGSETDVTWLDENNTTKNVNYRIPNQVQCLTCHKVKINNVQKIVPIGIKPQNLNFNFNYGNESKNQLTKWIEKGYLENNFALPTTQNTTVDYKDTSKDLTTRVRSYVDINCAHCHRAESHCYYRDMRFAFGETGPQNPLSQTNLGVCMNTADLQDIPQQYDKIVTPANINASMLYFRINTTNETYRMPLHGRTLIHAEGVALVAEWINSLTPCR